MTALVARPLPQRRLTGQRHALVATAHVRLMILMLMLAAGFALVIGRIGMLAFAAEPTSIQGPVSGVGPRGDILDRNGEPLARTIEAWTIGVHPGKLLGDKQELAAKLAAVLPGHDESWYYAKLTLPVSFTYLERHASPALVNAVHAIGEPGLAFAREPERLYPQTTMAAHVLGYIGPTGDDTRIMGRAGIERAFEDRLTSPSTRGTPVMLSIDSRVQAAMESELGRAMIAFKARSATGVVLDVHTGEVMAMVSLPVYNPNKLAGTSSDALRNNVTQSVYELGSTFKPITMATAIESGVVTSMAKRYDATEPLHVGGFTIHDDHAQKRFLDVPEALIHSSNIVTARIADEVGKDRMSAMFKAMGFDTRPEIELREKQKPIWPVFWARTTVMTTGYGHGIAVTPLHLANAYATLVNGGIWRPTTLLKVAPGKAPEGRRVLSEATSARMRQLLRLVVTQGTGRKGEAPGYRVGGKTGTAEVAGAGGYSKKANVSTFAAAFPMDAPRYVVIAMLDSPVGNAEILWSHHRRLDRGSGRQPRDLTHRRDAGRDARQQPRRGRLGAVAIALACARREPGGRRMKLAALTGGAEDATVTGFAIDHRKVAPGTIFGAFEGAQVNGEDFIPAAVAGGAIAVVARPEARVVGVTHIADANPRKRFAGLAARYFAPFPETAVAVTGTNGKTSTVEMTRQLWRMTGFHAASIGTLGVTTAGDQVSTGLTTPDIVTFLSNVAGLAREGVSHVAFEASSHGLSQYRTEGLPVRAAAFTNLSRDHLDYHGTMEAYFEAKLRLFSEVVVDGGAVVVWADDPHAARVIEDCGGAWPSRADGRHAGRDAEAGVARSDLAGAGAGHRGRGQGAQGDAAADRRLSGGQCVDRSRAGHRDRWRYRADAGVARAAAASARAAGARGDRAERGAGLCRLCAYARRAGGSDRGAEAACLGAADHGVRRGRGSRPGQARADGRGRGGDVRQGLCDRRQSALRGCRRRSARW